MISVRISTPATQRSIVDETSRCEQEINPGRGGRLWNPIIAVIVITLETSLRRIAQPPARTSSTEAVTEAVTVADRRRADPHARGATGPPAS